VRKTGNKDMTTEQGNKLIAEYMQFDFNNPSISEMGDKFGFWSEEMRPATIDDLQYHLSWDWLMPIVERITRFEFPDGQDYAYIRTFGMLDASNRFMVRINRMQVFHADTLIEATWLAVVDFIQSLPQ